MMLENGYLVLSSKPNMVIHCYRPLCLNCKVIDKCIHTKYVFEPVDYGGHSTCTLQTRYVRSTHAKDTLSKFCGRQA